MHGPVPSFSPLIPGSTLPTSSGWWGETQVALTASTQGPGPGTLGLHLGWGGSAFSLPHPLGCNLRADVAHVHGTPRQDASRWHSRPSSARLCLPHPFQPQPGEEGCSGGSSGSSTRTRVARTPGGRARGRAGHPAESPLPQGESFGSSWHGTSFGKRERCPLQFGGQAADMPPHVFLCSRGAGGVWSASRPWP